MAFLVGKSQQVMMAGLAPIAAYSRIVSVKLLVYEGWGWQYVLTPVLGNDVWLLGVDVVSEKKAIDTGQYSEFQVYAGGGRSVAIGDVANWDLVLPQSNNANQRQSWRITDGMSGFSWQFSKRYVGDGRRFALTALRYGEDISELQASFHISEG